MKVLRTPDEAFANLPGYTFEPQYVTVKHGDGTQIRMHYIDEGPKDGPVVLMLHGQPSWAYLYRKMIPIITAAGMRAVVPDLVGFGRSDKPAERGDYTYANHLNWLTQLIEQLNLRGINLMCQDWGGLLGLRIAAAHPDWFDRIVAANTGLTTGEFDMPQVWHEFKAFCENASKLPLGRMIQSGCATKLDAEVKKAYAAPYPDASYMEGARAFPGLVPIDPDQEEAKNNKAAIEVFRKWDKPFLTAFSDSDPITRGGDLLFRRLIPGCKDQPHTTIENGGHFLQEDQGEELAKVIVDFIQGS